MLKSELYSCCCIPGGYGHRDTVRGIVNTEANVRGSVMVASYMKFYDVLTRTNEYTKSDTYRNICKWIDSMKSGKEGFYEYQKESNMLRCGHGSIAQIFPCIWIFGRI